MDRTSVSELPAAPKQVSGRASRILFALFFFSGFCSLLYQVVWLRMAFAHFGVITPVLSVVLSVFMLGLGIGSILGGPWAERWSAPLHVRPGYLYGGAELIIGIGAFMVPLLFQAGADYLLKAGETSSTGYLFVSALFIVAAILPWCTMMGATVPLMMSFIAQTDPANRSSFSFLYLANVIGAMAGTVITALFLVEIFGFRGTSMIAATVNLLIAAVGFALARLRPFERAPLAGRPRQMHDAMRRERGRAHAGRNAGSKSCCSPQGSHRSPWRWRGRARLPSY